MANNELNKAISKGLKDSNLGGSRVLDPGATGRRYEPKGGLKTHNEHIHRESKQMDTHGNLPFTFSKPKKPARGSIKKCSNCGDLKSVNVNTVGIECKNCRQYSSLEEIG